MANKPRLSTLKGVRCEMVRVYQDARDGTIRPEDGSKLVYQLSAISATIQAELVEVRLARLETLANELVGTN